MPVRSKCTLGTHPHSVTSEPFLQLLGAPQEPWKGNSSPDVTVGRKSSVERSSGGACQEVPLSLCFCAKGLLPVSHGQGHQMLHLVSKALRIHQVFPSPDRIPEVTGKTLGRRIFLRKLFFKRNLLSKKVKNQLLEKVIRCIQPGPGRLLAPSQTTEAGALC